ncbi:MAG: molybdate ABC transporter substrate-binding protein [Eubacteriaceae bacterium]|nr:molybdate ABC transporter substrate-binding protein [Eubacteriaceae bacterium]
MKKLFPVFLALLLALNLFLSACGSSQPASSTEPEQIELVILAAASMTETLSEISGIYANVAPGITLILSFDSSGVLKTQIEEGAECDIFISAAPRQMDQLDIEASSDVNTGGLDFVLQGTRFNLLENKVALVVPSGNPKEISSFAKLAEMLPEGNILMAMGNSDVPVGQYTQRILQYFSLNEDNLAASGVISYGSNVKEVTTQVVEASVDCGVVYSTDAFSAGLEAVDYATLEMCGQVIYPAAVLNASQHQDAAKAFLEYLRSAEAMAVFERVGFAPAK